MSRTFFKSLGDWNRLREGIEEQLEARRESAIAAPDFASKEYDRGWYNALQWVLALPDEILKDEADGSDKVEATPAGEAEGAKRLVPERHPRSRGVY